MSFQFVLTSFFVILSPGAGVMYMVSVGLLHGRKAIVMAALGGAVGVLPHLLASELGIAALINASPPLFHAVKFAGVAYLFYLAWQSLRANRQTAAGPTALEETGGQVALRAATIAILNPQTSVFFLAFLPEFLTGDPETATLEIAFMGVLWIVLTFFIYMGYGLGAAGFQKRFLNGHDAMIWTHRAMALVFSLLACLLFIETV